ncbi:hypothetical protein ACTOB_005174 [Actinoplanes oblitus]|uniref:SUKH-4 immunity protein n=1 Tax=Actinoplanes oblitus TaxID=3040509 RepID=A0ABY8W6T5_9ACTN|nr:hypothetical protein [Actinoplanes oblitus]WIM93202.1 hypothetical protein ACTOB_005174 [Actinoplanes oblitus]
MTERRLLETIHGTPWIADLLTLFDFEVARAADGPIEPVTLASGEPWEAIAGDGTGGSFLLVGTGEVRPVLYVGSEGEGGLVARSLRDALTLVVGVSSLHDATTIPAERNDGRDLNDFLGRTDDEIREYRPELDADRDRLRSALGLPPVDDALLRSLQAAAADSGYRPLNQQGDRLRPMLAWLEEAEEAAHPRVPEPPVTATPSTHPDEPMPGQIALF